MMEFVLEMMDFILEMMNFVYKTMDFVFKMTISGTDHRHIVVRQKATQAARRFCTKIMRGFRNAPKHHGRLFCDLMILQFDYSAI